MEYLDLGMIIAAFGGGVFAASIGALPTFVFTGLLVIGGEALYLATGNAVVTGSVAFGPFFGPHVAFVGGVAAAAFAAKKGLVEMDKGKTLTVAAITHGHGDISVLVVGGLFGVAGHLLFNVLAGLGNPTDNIAITVYILNVAARMLFGKTGALGKHDPSVAPSRFGIAEDRSNAWLPWQNKWEIIILMSAAVGGLSAWVALTTGSAVLTFGISAASLLFIHFGHGMVVTHHITLPAAIAALATGNIFIGIALGVFGGLVGEIGSRLHNNWGDTWIDPPAFAIFIATYVVILVL